MKLYRSPTAMEPLLAGQASDDLAELSRRIFSTAGRLSNALHPVSANAVSKVVELMNSYYSNLIEGHHTYPREIEAAFRNDFASDPRKADLQRLGRAHVEVEEAMRLRLAGDDNLDITSPDFFRWLHHEFYRRLPDALRIVKDAGGRSYPVQAGEFRDHQVDVGRHIPPEAASIGAFLNRFSEVYTLAQIPATQRLIAAAAAHHRFLWIHPFGDGNGRVARLFTTACLIRAEVDASALWSMSRGLARVRERYYTALAGADARRRDSYDGRGNLSESGLIGFIRFFLETAVDQLGFMDDLLDLERLEMRIKDHFLRERIFGRQSEDAFRLLFEVIRRGTLPRGEAPRVTGKKETSARTVLQKLITAGYLTSDGPKKPVRIQLPAHLHDVYFPRLFLEF